jgi:hypothetical protein
MFKGNWTWTILGLTTLVIRYFAVQNPEKTEEIYSRSFFPGIRNLIDKTISQLPFATVYIFVVSVILVTVFFYLPIHSKGRLEAEIGFFNAFTFQWIGIFGLFFPGSLGIQLPKNTHFPTDWNETYSPQSGTVDGRNGIDQKYCQSATLQH